MRSSCLVRAPPAQFRGFPLHQWVRVALVEAPWGPSWAPHRSHQTADSLILWRCPLPICALHFTKSVSVASQRRVGEPLQRAGAMAPQFLDQDSQTTHLKVFPHLVKVCPPSEIRLASIVFFANSPHPPHVICWFGCSGISFGVGGLVVCAEPCLPYPPCNLFNGAGLLLLVRSLGFGDAVLGDRKLSVFIGDCIRSAIDSR